MYEHGWLAQNRILEQLLQLIPRSLVCRMDSVFLALLCVLVLVACSRTMRWYIIPFAFFFKVGSANPAFGRLAFASAAAGGNLLAATCQARALANVSYREPEHGGL